VGQNKANLKFRSTINRY